MTNEMELRFDEIETAVAMGQMDAHAVFTQMRTAALYMDAARKQAAVPEPGVIRLHPDDAAALERAGIRVEFAVAPQAEQPVPQCKCSMSIRVLGDGCQVCNPDFWAEFMADQAEKDRAEQVVKSASLIDEGASEDPPAPDVSGMVEALEWICDRSYAKRFSDARVIARAALLKHRSNSHE